MIERTLRLRELMKQHKLKSADVGVLLGRKPQTVRSWTCGYAMRSIPAQMLELLEFKLSK